MFKDMVILLFHNIEHCVEIGITLVEHVNCVSNAIQRGYGNLSDPAHSFVPYTQRRVLDVPGAHKKRPRMGAV